MTAELEAPADVVWQVVGEEFGEIAGWTGMLTSSHLEGELGEGAVRHCTFPPDLFSKDGSIRERLVHFDRTRRELEYFAEQTPFFAERAGSRWQVQAIDHRRSRIVLRGIVQLRWWAIPAAPLLRLMLRRMAMRLSRELHEQVRRRAAAT